MKKIIYIYLMFFLVLSWCSIKTETIFDISFEQAEIIVSENINFLVQEIKWVTAFQNYWTDCDFSSDNDSIQLESNINFSWFTNKQWWKTDISVNSYFWDKKWKKELNLSWNIENISINDNYFIEFQNPIIDLWKWNYESNFWLLITKNLSNKWINYNSKKINELKKIKKDINFIVNTTSSSSNFQNLWQVTYEWNLAYKFSIKPENLDYINKNSDIKISKIEWLFIIIWKDEVNCKITEMEISYLWKDIKINWDIWNKQLSLNFFLDDEKTNISYDLSKRSSMLKLQKSKNFSEIWSINTKFSKSQKASENKIGIKWTMILSPILIYWSDLEKELEINIRCSYENISWENLKITLREPDSYILLDQILWDEFSMKNFIWD